MHILSSHEISQINGGLSREDLIDFSAIGLGHSMGHHLYSMLFTPNAQQNPSAIKIISGLITFDIFGMSAFYLAAQYVKTIPTFFTTNKINK